MSVERKKVAALEVKFPRVVLIALAAIVFISGFCSLTYQVVWLREFRLIFGGAAPAASAVLAVFMGGLGLGGLYLGKRVERAVYPGRMYAWIEGWITIATVFSPLLLLLIQKAYVATGGVQTLGLFLATTLQLLMTVIVIGPACFMMGGTLPAALRVVQSDADSRRVTTAVFYGVNVAGAVTGAYLATFVFLQNWGNLWTLLGSCAVNAVIAVLAYVILHERKREPEAAEAVAEKVEKKKGKAVTVPSPPRSKWFFPGLAFLSGFAFFLIELVWYRVSIPLFGGSVYNFGLILAVALAGIGSGSLLYSLLLTRREPTMGLFALISSLLALTMIVPFAMGDRLAYAALLLNTFYLARSFEGLVFGWTIICAILVFLPAFFAGVQFPLLVSLMGKGGRGIAEQIGNIYAWNTLGAVSGSLIGGFVLIPLLSISGGWRFAALVALSISVAALVKRRKQADLNQPKSLAGKAAILSGGLALWCMFATTGPSAFWLHHPIGYGRVDAMFGAPPEVLENYVRQVNRSIVATKDGRESSLAVANLEDLFILTNGKSDSSSISDSSTTVMSGLAGAILHPNEVKQACVIGYGTGITVGWMNKIESLERLDIMELEQASIDLGSYFSKVNFDAAKNPKAHVLLGDAREMLVARGQMYDYISSEPSNLHRAGVANLYTKEFYESVKSRLNADGIFCQWVQTYEIEEESVRIVIATLSDVFAKVELWQAGRGDMMLICSNQRQPWDVAKIRNRLKEETYQTAVRNLWGTDTLEGFISRAVANADYARWLASKTLERNTDDLNLLEFRAARSLGTSSQPMMQKFSREADTRGEMIPGLTKDGSGFDAAIWVREYLWKSFFFNLDVHFPSAKGAYNAWPEEVIREAEFVDNIRSKSAKQQVEQWPLPVSTEAARLQWLGVLAQTADPRFTKEIEEIRHTWPAEYHVLKAEHAIARQQFQIAFNEYFSAVERLSTQPTLRNGYQRAIWQGIEKTIPNIQFESAEQLKHYFELSAKPLSFAEVTDPQRLVMMGLAAKLPLPYKVRAAECWGKFAPWEGTILKYRMDIFQQASHAGYQKAKQDYEKWQQAMKSRGMEIGSDGSIR